MRFEIPLGREVRLEAMSFRDPDGKANTRDTWFGLCFATPEEKIENAVKCCALILKIRTKLC